MNEGIGVEHLRAQLAQHRRDGRLPRPDRSSETDDTSGQPSSLGGDGSLTFAHSSYSSRSDRSSAACSSPMRRVSM